MSPSGGTLPSRSRRSTTACPPIGDVHGRDLERQSNVDSRRSIAWDESYASGRAEAFVICFRNGRSWRLARQEEWFQYPYIVGMDGWAVCVRQVMKFVLNVPGKQACFRGAARQDTSVQIEGLPLIVKFMYMPLVI